MLRLFATYKLLCFCREKSGLTGAKLLDDVALGFAFLGAELV
jgi:hypothetical protein